MANADIFHDNITITNKNTGIIRLARNTNMNYFMGNIYINSIASGSVLIETQGSGKSILFPGKKILFGQSGFLKGLFGLYNFFHADSSEFNFTMSGTASLRISGTTTFYKKARIIAPFVIISGGVFNDSTYIEKTGAGDATGLGGAEFRKHVEFVNSGSSGSFYLGSQIPDKFLANVTLTNTNTGLLKIARNSGVNYFPGDIYVNSISTGNVWIETLLSGKSILAKGKNILIGKQGLSSGTFGISNFYMEDSLDFNFTLSGTAGFAVSGTTTFYKKVKVVAPNIYINGGIFQDSAYFEKTSFGQNNGTGGATFLKHVEIANSGSGIFYLGLGAPDIFQQNLTLTNKGTGQILIARNSTINYLGGNVIINSTTGGTVGIDSQTTGKAILASGKKIIIGNQGFTKGSFMLSNFFLEDSSDFNLTLSGSSTFIVSRTSTFYKKIKIQAPGISINGGIFHDSAYFEKSGSTHTGGGSGGAVFNKHVEFVNSGGGIFYVGTITPDVYNTDATFTVLGSGDLHIARNSSLNYFKGNIYVNSRGSGEILFNFTQTANLLLASGKKIETGKLGFSAGKLSLYNFTTEPSANINLNFTGTGSYYMNGGTYNGKLSVTSPEINLNGVVFKDSVFFNKTGSLNNNFIGPNTFEKPVKILVSNGNLYLGEGTYSTNTIFNFKDNINLSQLNSGKVHLAYNGAVANLEADLSIDALNAFPLIGYSGGQINFIGNKNHSLIYRDTLQINKMSVNKPEGKLLLNTSLKFVVSDSKIPSLNLVKGNINTGNSCVFITDGTILTGGSEQCFVEGKVKKTGASAFTFPIGKNGIYRPVTMSAPGNSSAAYEVEYFNSDPADRNNLGTSVKSISICEYYSFTRTGSYNVSFSPAWTNSCTRISDQTKVVYKNTVTGKWELLPGGSVTGTTAQGSFNTGVLTSYGLFTLTADGSLLLNSSALPARPFSLTSAGTDGETFVSGSAGTNSGMFSFDPAAAVVNVNFPAYNGYENITLNINISDGHIASVEAVAGGKIKYLKEESFSLLSDGTELQLNSLEYYPASIIINAVNVNPSVATVNDGDKIYTLTTGTPASEIVVHPPVPVTAWTSEIDISIPTGFNNKAGKIKVYMNKAGEVDRAEIFAFNQYLPLAKDFYSIKENKIIFHNEKEPVFNKEITNNLPDGISFDKAVTSKLIVNVQGLTVTSFSVKDKSDAVIFQHSSLPEWNGNNAAGAVAIAGSYRYEIVVVQDGTNYTFTGQLIFKP
jgi:hypothetical protein